MSYDFNDLKTLWLSKTFVYKYLRTPLPFSNEMDWNKRVFSDSDIEIFQSLKTHGYDKTAQKYIVPTLPTQDAHQTTNIDEQIEKAVKQQIETLSVQYAQKEKELTDEIQKKDNAIQDRIEQAQKSELLRIEETNEKKEWQKKYESSQYEVRKWMNLFYLMIIFFIVVIFSILFIYTK
jgi:uncharacterized membrane protein